MSDFWFDALGILAIVLILMAGLVAYFDNRNRKDD